jgi:uncharacterized protein YjbI with pentapeptide repeats
MNREETLALYERAQKEGVEVWNDWANQRLEEQKKLKETEKWKVNADGEPVNHLTKDWFSKAEAIFSENNSGGSLNNTANFNDFIFPGEVQFRYFEFKQEAFFSGAIFHQRAFFDYASFKGLTLFTNTKFIKWAFFENATFHDEVAFQGEVCKINANFKKAYFYKHAVFSTPLINTTFEEAVFENSATFNNSKFYEITTFSNVTFEGLTKFQNVKFYGITDFQNSKFNETTYFSEAKFSEKSMFDSAHFKRVAHYDEAVFIKNAFFTTTLFEGYTSFKKTIFKQNANLNAIQSDSAFNLEKATFEKEVPDFIQANFKEAPRLDNINIEDDISPGSFKNSITTFIHPDIKARYQALKRIAIQAHDHENEQKFWAGELRSDRSLKNEDGSWNWRPVFSAFWWGNIAYDCFSDFGRSIVRPLISLFILLCIMTNIHLLAHNSIKDNHTSELRTKTHITKQSDLKDCDIRSSAFRVAAKNGAIGLLQNPAKRSTFVRDYTCLYGTYNDNVTPKIPNSIFWIELFHTLLSAILIFLTLLGIRNNFKLK